MTYRVERTANDGFVVRYDVEEAIDLGPVLDRVPETKVLGMSVKTPVIRAALEGIAHGAGLRKTRTETQVFLDFETMAAWLKGRIG